MHSCKDGCCSKKRKMHMDLRYLAGKSDTQISPVKAFDFFSIPKPKPAYQSHEDPRVFEDEIVKTALATEVAAPSDDEDEPPVLKASDDEESEFEETEPPVFDSKKKASKPNRRIDEMEVFLTQILDPNLEDMCAAMNAHPSCSEPGCKEKCDLHCDSCCNFYCVKHHRDEGNTHSTRYWSDVPSRRNKTLLLPGFQESIGAAKIDTTPSFCYCSDPSPKSSSVLLLRKDFELIHTELVTCTCRKKVAILFANRYLQVTNNFAVHFKLLEMLREADASSIQMWVRYINMANEGKNENIDHFRLNLAKMAYCQYLKRVKIKRTCYMCLDPETRKLLVQELGLDFTNVQCASHRQATQREAEGIMLDVVTDRGETEEDRKLLAEACTKCSSSLPDGTPYESKDKEKSCKDKFDGDFPDLKETEEELLHAPIRKFISAVCGHSWIFKFLCCYSKGERKQQLLIAIRKILADYDMSVERYLADDPCHILKLTEIVAEFLPTEWRKQFIDFFNVPGNVSMGGMHCWNHVPECMNAIFFKNWIVSLFGEMVEGPFAHIKKNMGSDSNLIKSYFKISMESRIDAYLDKRFRNMANTNLAYRIEENPKKIRALEEEVQALILKLEKNGGLERGIVDLKRIRQEYLLPILRWKVEELMDERKCGLSYEYIKHRLRAFYFEIKASSGVLPIQKSKLSMKLWNHIAGPWTTDTLPDRLTSSRKALVASAKKLHESDETFPAKLEKQPPLEGKLCQQLIDGFLIDILLPSTHEKLHLLLREIQALKSKKTYGAERKSVKRKLDEKNKQVGHLKGLYSAIRKNLLETRLFKGRREIMTLREVTKLAKDPAMTFDANLREIAGLKIRLWQKARHLWTRIHIDPLLETYDRRYFANILLELLDHIETYLKAYTEEATEVDRMKAQIGIREICTVFKSFKGKKFESVPVVANALVLFDRIEDDFLSFFENDGEGHFVVSRKCVLKKFAPYGNPPLPKNGPLQDDLASVDMGLHEKDESIAELELPQSASNFSTGVELSDSESTNSGTSKKRRQQEAKEPPKRKKPRLRLLRPMIQPPKLRNLDGHNNCFLNSMLQILFAIPNFTKILEELAQQPGLEEDISIIKLVHNLSRESNPQIDYLREKLGFEKFTQEDAFESLLQLMSKFEKFPELTSIINLSITQEATNSISNDNSSFIVLRGTDNLQIQINSYFSDISNEGVRFRLDGMGDTLMICLGNLFLGESQNGRRLKNKVNCPEIPEQMILGGKTLTLVSALVHQGNSLRRGHYYTICNRFGKTWKCNDRYITRTGESILAYLKRTKETPYGVCYVAS